jgi:hypothetical protein
MADKTSTRFTRVKPAATHTHRIGRPGRVDEEG